ncbi:MAG TPA: hypothetical protein GX516_02000 [Thermoanaerobacter sp.]|nr:hypothetical protein [Thermoanaerobacter sp.]
MLKGKKQRIMFAVFLFFTKKGEIGMSLIKFLMVLLIINILAVLTVIRIESGKKEFKNILKTATKNLYWEIYKDIVTLHLYYNGLITPKEFFKMFIQNPSWINAGLIIFPHF